jgi:hypothetical protein
VIQHQSGFTLGTIAWTGIKCQYLHALPPLSYSQYLVDHSIIVHENNFEAFSPPNPDQNSINFCHQPYVAQWLGGIFTLRNDLALGLCSNANPEIFARAAAPGSVK